MGTKVKGLFKGLKHIFDEKDKEIEIGFPTDVKHVGHIGWDGPAANNNSNPSWMKEFNSGPLDATTPLDASGPLSSKEEPPSEESTHKEKKKHRSRRSYSAGLPPDSPSKRSGEVRRHSRRQESSDSPRSSDGSKHSRRHRSSSKSMDGMKESSGSSRGARRSKHSSQGCELPAQDDQPPSIPKHSRVRKSRGSCDASKSKEQNNSEDGFPTDPGSKDIAVQQS